MKYTNFWETSSSCTKKTLMAFIDTYKYIKNIFPSLGRIKIREWYNTSLSLEKELTHSKVNNKPDSFLSSL